MSTSTCSRWPLGMAKRLRLSPNTNTLLPRIRQASFAQAQLPENNSKETKSEAESLILQDDKIPPYLRAVDASLRETLARAPLPRSLTAMHLAPLRRQAEYGIPVCDLQLRSYSLHNLQFFSDFAMRVAYYLGLPARGPVPLPRITERWTVPRSNFVHKKSQENFERRTVRRLIQIQDGHPEVVQCWLGYLEKRAYHGIGMKANVWELEGLGVGKRMDEQAGIVDESLEEEWGNFGMRMNVSTAEKVEELLGSETFNEPKRLMEDYWREPIEIKRKK